jgi:hypothetical protein
MAILDRIAMPGTPSQGLESGFGMGDKLLQHMMQRRLNEQQMQQNKDLLGIRREEMQERAKRSQSSQDLSQQLMQLKKQQEQRLLQKQMFDQDPDAQVNFLKTIAQKLQGQEPTPADDMQSFVPAIPNQAGMASPKPDTAQDIPAINDGAVSPYDAAEGGADINMETIAQSPLLRAFFKKQFGVDLGAHTSSPYQGAARDAYDLDRLKKEVGEDSDVYKNAKRAYESNLENKETLGQMRQQGIEGLKKGERWMYDPESGNKIGKEVPLTSKERDEHRGRAKFDYIYPHIYKGAAPLSGQESYSKLINASRNYETDPQSQQLIDDFLLSQKLLTAGVVNEAATLGAGKQKATYQQLRESLQASDIPKRLTALVKQFGLPASAAEKASKRFQDIIDKSTEYGNQKVPAYQKLYFNAEGQSSPQTPQMQGHVNMIDPKSGKIYPVPQSQVDEGTKRGWKRA